MKKNKRHLLGLGYASVLLIWAWYVNEPTDVLNGCLFILLFLVWNELWREN